MANLFDTANTATTEPEKIVAGDRLIFKRTDLHANYANSAYTLKDSARLEGTGSTAIKKTASASHENYLVEVASAPTASYSTGVRKASTEKISGRWVYPTRDHSVVGPQNL